MPIEITLSNDDSLDFRPGLPDTYNGPILRGALSYAAKTNIADIVIQEFVGELYTIRFAIGKFFKKVTAKGTINNTGLYSYFMLKAGTRKEVSTIGKFHLRQDYDSNIYIPGSATCSASFEKNNEFRCLDIFYSPKLLEELTPFFPELKELLLTSNVTSLRDRTNWTLPSMKEISNQILNCPYDEETCRFYFDLKVRELLYQLLERTYKRKSNQYSFTPWEVSKIHEARDILAMHIATKPPSIKSLSRKVALNEFKLKTGFKQYFNAGLFEWLLEEKMQHAKKLVLTTNKPIKQICNMVGYPRTTNFITAFRRRFGCTPGALRRS